MAKDDEANTERGGFDKSADRRADKALQKSVDKDSVESLTEGEKKTLQQRKEIGSSSASGAFADANGEGGLPSAKDVLGQFAHGEQGLKSLQGYVSNSPQETDFSKMAKPVSEVSEMIGKAFSNSVESFRELVESGKTALGLNPTEQKQTHPPTGDMSTLAQGVGSLEDVAHAEIGSVKGLIDAINIGMQELTPEGMQRQAQQFGKSVLDGTVGNVRTKVDPIGTLQDDFKKVEPLGQELTEWATNRSAETFGERGRDGGEFIPVLEAGQGFIARKRDSLTESMKHVNERGLAKLLNKSVKEMEVLTDSEVKELAKKLDIDLVKIEKVGDPPRMPINWQYAGRTYKFDECELAKTNPTKAAELQVQFPEGVRFGDEGFPDFEPYAQHKVEISYSGRRLKDFEIANKLVGLEGTPDGWTWHHHQDGKTMLLVPEKLHDNVRHTGGCSTSGLPYRKEKE
ncbi:MAG: HNH endonuclease [Candidatus Obscuribacterales bacterium]|jgi:hypothetical protein|nr:HNH endonuclease [Candidatus Obscuribacterales bacterium]